MSKELFQSTKKAFQLSLDLINSIEETSLTKKLPNLKSNKIGQQFWCIIGARESYLKALEKQEWTGFSCSLKDSFSKTEILTKLKESASSLAHFSETILSTKQNKILLDLYTH